jgi:hypothetical protein
VRANHLSYLLLSLIPFHSFSAYAEADSTTKSNYEQITIEAYHLDLAIDPYQRTLSGSVAYDFIARTDAERIILDAQAQQIKDVTETVAAAPKPLIYHTENNSLAIDRPFRRGEHFTITIRFAHPAGANKESHGINWVDAAETRSGKYPLAFTQLESIEARKLLPCQDTPKSTAYFETKLTVPQTLQGYASGDLVNTQYKTDFRIPIYLYAILVGKLSQSTVDDNVEVISEAEIHEPAILLAKKAAAIIKYYERYLDRDFPLPHLRIAFLPPGYRYGGMENMGFIFVNDAVTTSDNQPFLIHVLPHEIAHHWFGNLLTLAGWRDIWVNEGATTYLERVYMEQLLPAQVTEMDWQQRRSRSTAAQYNQDRSVWGSLNAEVFDIASAPHLSDMYDKGSWIYRELQQQIGSDGVRWVLASLVHDINEHQLIDNPTLLDRLVTGAQAYVETEKPEIHPALRLEHIRDLVMAKGGPILSVVCHGQQVTVTQDARQTYQLGRMQLKILPAGNYLNVTIDAAENQFTLPDGAQGAYLDPHGKRYAEIRHDQCFKPEELFAATNDYRIIDEFKAHAKFLAHLLLVLRSRVGDHGSLAKLLRSYPLDIRAALDLTQELEAEAPNLAKILSHNDTRNNSMLRWKYAEMLAKITPDHLKLFQEQAPLFIDQLTDENSYRIRPPWFAILLGVATPAQLEASLTIYLPKITVPSEWNRILDLTVKAAAFDAEKAARVAQQILEFGAANVEPAQLAQLRLRDQLKVYSDVHQKDPAFIDLFKGLVVTEKK